MTGHDYHQALPGYHPDQVLKDGCHECSLRSGDVFLALMHMDLDAFTRAWHRAIDWQRGRLMNVSAAETPLLRCLWAVSRMLGQLGCIQADLAPVSPAPENRECVNAALRIAHEYGVYDGDHHKAWVIDQMCRVLGGPSMPDPGIAP